MNLYVRGGPPENNTQSLKGLQKISGQGPSYFSDASG